jgi:archaellum component FlaC
MLTQFGYMVKLKRNQLLIKFMKKNEEITKNELARMVQKGFQSMDEKMEKGFQSIDERFQGIDKRFQSMDEKVDRIDRRLSNVENQVDSLQRGQEKIHDRLDEMSINLKEQNTILKQHDRRITGLEKKVLGEAAV